MTSQKTSEMPGKLGQALRAESKRSRVPASFRDRDGFVYFDAEHGILRQVNRSYQQSFEQLMKSGLYDLLVKREMLVAHEEESLSRRLDDEAFAVLRPNRIPFISYPYEWSFNALKDAALLTLDIQSLALERGLTLKDASAYNVQFVGAKPIFIDTLSFVAREPGQAWAAYGQFCRHFLAPLALMAKRDIRLQKLLASHIDGIPLDLTGRLLPKKCWFSLGLVMHIYLHAMAVERNGRGGGGAEGGKKSAKVSDNGLKAIIANLRRVVERLEWQPKNSTWSNYYNEHTYTSESEAQKLKCVEDALKQVRPSVVWDIGANTGLYSRLAAKYADTVIAFDYDPLCVDRLYQHTRQSQESIVSLVMDLANPSAAIGWANQERSSLVERGPADLTLALAVMHHIVIGNNVPLDDLAAFFWQTSRNVVIEFVPPEDVQVQRLLRTRKELPHPYSKEEFERAFSRHFELVRHTEITDGDAAGRILYLARRKGE